MADYEIIEGLRTCELFTPLTEEEMQKVVALLAGSCQMQAYEAGHTVFTQGEHSTRLYVVAEGQVLLERSFYLGERTATRPVALLGRGRAMGWTALLYGPSYATASAVCQKPAQVIAMEGAALRSVLEGDHSIGFKVMERLACMLGDRLRVAYSAMETHL
jgi:CRP-like cAMP-binding protein